MPKLNYNLKSARFSTLQLAIFIIVFGIVGYLIFRALAAPNPNLQGDLNNDNTVNITDLSILLSSYGTTNSTADINSDGTVNILDLSTLLSHYGQSYVPPITVNCDKTLTAGGSVAAFFNALTPGQTGCLRAGDYASASTWTDLTANGTTTGRITLTSYPGETATIHGAVQIDGAYTTLTKLRIDGSNTFRPAGAAACTNPSAALHIEGHDTIIDHVEVYDSEPPGSADNGVAIFLGGQSPDNSIVRFNKIHDYGHCYHYDHGIYVGDGTNLQVYNNWIWNGRYGQAIQVYPDPNNANIYGNVIDGAGAGFDIADDGSLTSTGNKVYHNIVANPTGMSTPTGGTICGAGITSTGPVAGSNNSFNTNDVWNAPCGIGSVANVEMTGNIISDPLFVNAAAHDYRVQAASPNASWGLWDGN